MPVDPSLRQAIAEVLEAELLAQKYGVELSDALLAGPLAPLLDVVDKARAWAAFHEGVPDTGLLSWHEGYRQAVLVLLAALATSGPSPENTL